MAIKNQIKAEIWRENPVSIVPEKEIKNEEVVEVENTPVEEKKSKKKKK